jgi:hypothetical protein
MKRAGLSSAPSKTLNYSQASDAKDRVRMESPNAMAMTCPQFMYQSL